MEGIKNEANGKDIQKVMIIGLDDAGKTSIILALRREFSKIGIINPTKGIQSFILDILGTKLSVWDLGGQRNYRREYLKQPRDYFTNTKIVIYVIDIQNHERISESLSYFKDTMKQFKNLKIYPSVFVFFHKFDPELSERTQNSLNELILDVQNKIQTKVDYNIFFFYNTTIYELSTIINAMSEVLLTLYLKSEIVEKTIKNFAEKINAEAAQLIDNNSLIVGSYYKNEKAKEILIATAPHFLNLSDSFSKLDSSEDLIEDRIISQKLGKYFVFKKFSLNDEASPYYMLLSKDNPSFNKEDYDILVNLLKHIVYK